MSNVTISKSQSPMIPWSQVHGTIFFAILLKIKLKTLTKVQSVIIKQQSSFKCYNLCTMYTIRVRQCLNVVFCLSVTFSPSSFLDTGNQNTSTHSDLKLVGASATSQTLSLAVSATFTLYKQRMHTQDDGYSQPDATRSSHFSPLCLISA